MAQLYFYYSAMNAGKSTTLLQSAYNYNERGMRAEIFTASFDDRFGQGKVASRIGLESRANLFTPETNLIESVQQLQEQDENKTPIDCVLIDEAQFLKREQVKQATKLVDEYKIPVLAYGLRTDFQGETFEGAQYLLAWADKLVELKTVCFCGRKANFVVRRDENGNPVREGSQVQIGGNDSYESMCRKHFQELIW